MFNKIWDQSRLPKKKETSATFQTEKEAILYVIEKYDEKDTSSRYFSSWHKESEYGIKYPDRSLLSDFDFWSKRRDKEVFKQLAKKCADEDILRALFNRDEVDKILDKYFPFSRFLKNPNLPADIIDKLFEKYPCCSYTIRTMPTVGYKYISDETKAKIDARIAEWDAVIRKNKEKETKQKLTAFLTTAAATKSVLTGSSIDDVVEQTITSDVDDSVLDYMNQLFNK